MNKENKISYVQIRVSPSEKRAIVNLAQTAKMGMSEWILSALFPSQRREFEKLLTQLAADQKPRYALADIHDFLKKLSADEFQKVVSAAPGARLSSYWENYLAAMVEYAAHQKGVRVPAWTRDIHPLDKPVFGSDLAALRLHLLFASPPCFRKRNIFIDSTIGDRV